MLRLFPILLALSLISACGGSSSSKTSSEGNDKLGEIPWNELRSIGNDIVAVSRNTDRNFDEIWQIKLEEERHYKLSRDMKEGGKVARFLISPDGKKVAYIADQDSINNKDVYIASATGDYNIKVSNNIPSEYYPKYVYWSYDSSTLTYRVEHKSDPHLFKFYSVDLYSGKIDLANDQTDPLYAEIPDYESAYKSARSEDQLALVVSDPTSDTYKLSIYELTGDIREVSQHSLLNYRPTYLNWDAEGENLIIKGHVRETTSGAIYSYENSSTDLVTVYQGRLLSASSMSPNKTEFAYWAESDNSSFYELYVFNINSKRSIKVSDTANNELNSLRYFQWLDNGLQLIYGADLNERQTKELYVSNADGSGSENLSSFDGSTRALDNFILSPQQHFVAFKTTGSNRTSDVFIGDLNSFSVTDISLDLDIENRILHWAWLSDGESIVLQALQFPEIGYTLIHFNTLTRRPQNIYAAPGENREIICFGVHPMKSSCNL